MYEKYTRYRCHIVRLNKLYLFNKVRSDVIFEKKIEFRKGDKFCVQARTQCAVFNIPRN